MENLIGEIDYYLILVTYLDELWRGFDKFIIENAKERLSYEKKITMDTWLVRLWQDKVIT